MDSKHICWLKINGKLKKNITPIWFFACFSLCHCLVTPGFAMAPHMYKVLTSTLHKGFCYSQPNSHYIRYRAASVLRSTDTGWRVHGKWGTTRSPSLPGNTVNTPQWPWMCPPGRQWQGTFDCPLPWCTSMAIGCRVLSVGHHSTTVTHYGNTLQPMCSY